MSTAPYDELIKRTFDHMREGMTADNTSKKMKVLKNFDEMEEENKDNPISSANHVLRGRFSLGGDDACYLQSGLSMLWTTAATATRNVDYSKSEILAPPGLYAPDAVDGIRQGLIRGMQAKRDVHSKEAPVVLRQLLQPISALVELEPIQAVIENKTNMDKKDILELLAIDWTPKGNNNAVHLKRLTEVLNVLMSALDETDPNASPYSMLLRAVKDQQEKLNECQTASPDCAITVPSDEPSWLVDAATHLEQLPSPREHADEVAVLKRKVQDAELRVESMEKAAVREKDAKAKLWRMMSSTKPTNGTWASIAVGRGLVGQRGPTEPTASSEHCGHDQLLRYDLPSKRKLGRCIPQVRDLLATTEDSTPEEVARARSRLGVTQHELSRPALVDAIHALNHDFAVTGMAVAHSDDDRDGVEMPYGVRWMPSGARGETMAKVAVLEHAIARCRQVASSKGTSASVVTALRTAAAALKMRQLEDLYALHEAVQYDDDPHPIGTEVPLVTRPCAVVRGVLSFPIDSGVALAVGTRHDTSADAPMSAASDLKMSMQRTHLATAEARNRLRRAGVTGANLYVAPPVGELLFHPAPDHATATGIGYVGMNVVCEQVSAHDLSITTLSRIMRRALVYVAALDNDTNAVVNGVLDDALNGSGTFVSAIERRDALWSEFRRNVAISQDRLWVFVRHMSGCIGGDVNEVITMADEATLKATKAIQDQRVSIARRVSDMQAKIVETVVGSMVRDSNLTMDKAGESLVVIDGATRKQLAELASGESGRPFFEANVAARNLTDPEFNKPTKLSALLSSLSSVGIQLQESLESTLTQSGTASASLTELSHPANCYFVSIRTDATAAIRIAHERLNVELGMNGVGRRIHMWELVEGGCMALTTRFSEFAGHILVQSRSSTGVSALYVSQQAIQTNAYQARMSLDRLVRIGAIYATRVSMPTFNGNLADRKITMDAGDKINEIDIGLQFTRRHGRVGTRFGL